MSPSQRCRKHSALLLEAALRAVAPENLIKKKFDLHNGILSVAGNRFDLGQYRRVHLLGLGKGAAGLCREFEKIAGSRISGGVVVSREIFRPKSNNLTSLTGDHPVPGINSVKAGNTLKRYTENIAAGDMVLAFITGGASAMAVAPAPGISPEDLAYLNRLLVRSGAGIGEINTVRKHLSAIKGGMLAKRMYPATIVSCLLSDVAGSDPGTIGSGPFHGDSSTFANTLKVLKKYNIHSQCSREVTGYLERGVDGLEEETPGPDHTIFKNNHTFILGNNRVALEGAASKAVELGYRPQILPGEAAGDVETAARKTSERMRKQALKKEAGKQIILFGGEFTVSVTGKGKGGRVQEFLLLLLRELQNVDFPFFVAGAGTDGLDGNSGDAGAWIDHRTLAKLGDHPDGQIRDHLERNDSNTFFRNLHQHIHTGATDTNVMDVFMVFV